MGTNHGGVNFGRRLPPIGGQYSTPINNTGDLRTRTTPVTFLGEAPGEADIDERLDVSNTSISPEYIGVELAGGGRDWSLTGGARSTTARDRVELSVLGSYWLAPLSDLTGRRLPTTLCSVRLKGQVGAPPRRVLKVDADQAVSVPTANGVWSQARQPSRNPAAILRAFARGWYDTAERSGGGPAPTGRLLAGTGRDPETIDDAVLARFYWRCENHDPPLRCDLALQGDERPAEAIERLIAATGRAEISWATGKLGVVWTEPDDAPQGLISPAKVLPGTLSLSWRDGPLPDDIVVSYLDRTVWEGREVRVLVPGADGGGRERQVRLEGVTDADAATFHAASIAADEAFHRRAVSWRAGREGALMTRGSLWLMAADLLSGGVTGRLREFGEGRVRLDRPVRLTSQAWLAIDAPGADLHRTPVLRADPDPDGGDTDALILVEPFPGIGASDTSKPRDVVWRLYDLGLPPKPVRILSNRPVSKTEFDIVARDEVRDYWTFLDDYRAAAATPGLVTDLPDRVRLTLDGAWNWPQAWTDAGIEDASLIVFGAARGARGAIQPGGTYITTYDEQGPVYAYDPPAWGSVGAAGEDTTVTFGSTMEIVPGQARASTSTFSSPGLPRQDWKITSADAPVTFDFGAGGRGGAGGRNGTGQAARGADGAGAYAEIVPLPP